MVLGLSPVAVTSHFGPASSKAFLDIHATIECGFTLKRVRDMTRIYSHVLLIFTWQLIPVHLTKTLLRKRQMRHLTRRKLT